MHCALQASPKCVCVLYRPTHMTLSACGLSKTQLKPARCKHTAIKQERVEENTRDASQLSTRLINGTHCVLDTTQTWIVFFTFLFFLIQVWRAKVSVTVWQVFGYLVCEFVVVVAYGISPFCQIKWTINRYIAAFSLQASKRVFSKRKRVRCLSLLYL